MPHAAPSHAHLAPLLCPPSAFPHPTASPYPGSVQLLQKPTGDGAQELSACSRQPLSFAELGARCLRAPSRTPLPPPATL